MENWIIFDRLKKYASEEGLSLWKGQRGIYAFKIISPQSPPKANYPIRRVFLNRKFITGLFKSKEGYSGDIVEGQNKRRLFFKPLGLEEMEIYERVATQKPGFQGRGSFQQRGRREGPKAFGFKRV